MAEVLDYRRRLEKPPRRSSEGEARLLSMQNERDDGYRKARAEQRDRQFTTALASALRQIYMVHGDSLMSDLIRSNADLEARKILSCQT